MKIKSFRENIMITFDEKNKVFYLSTEKTSYIIGLLNGELPIHIHWGKRIDRIPDDWGKTYTRRALSAYDRGEFSSNTLPQEYPTFGNADNRIPAMQISSGVNGQQVKLKFSKYEIESGKPALEGLPATYTEADSEADTLKITMTDAVQQLEVTLYYTVFNNIDAITRSTVIKNLGEKTVLCGAMSAAVDFYGMADSDILTLDGTWTRERQITRKRITSGNQCIESRCGASSAYHSPFMAVCSKDAAETQGDVYGFSLVYSGDFVAGVELDAYNTARAYIGINPFQFSYTLESNDTFCTPEAVLVYSANGIGEMSRIYHKLYRTRLCRGKYRDSERFVLINNWEATYFDFNEEKLVKIAEKAAQIGIDTMVLDDGWFGKRTADNAGLGDWVENPDRLPNGLRGLADKINALGMRFGLWFEPEMVNPDSDLYRAHPDWILHAKGRQSSLVRNQLTLDLSRKDVCDYITEAVSDVLSKANIEYVKWDMNRYMSEVGSSELPADRQGEVKHRYMLGLYSVLETLTQRFPNVLFESCASGGGRFDPGMLYYMPQTWTSDDSDAAERLRIQYGTSIVYPYSSMGAHVSAVPNHQIGRITSFEMRCDVALPGQFGFELDLNKCTDHELEIAKKKVREYRELQEVFHKGDCYRLKSPFETDLSAVEFVSEDKKTAVVCISSYKATAYSPDEFIKPQGLCENATYRIGENSYDGKYLMNYGIVFRNDRENKSEIIVMRAE